MMASPPKEDIRVLILGTCDYVTLHGKRDFAGMIKDLEMILDYLGGPNVITGSL